MIDSVSEKRLVGVHENLAALFALMVERSPVRLIVSEGLRSPARQQKLFDRKATKTLNSRHLTGHAIDVAPILADGKVPWHDVTFFDDMAKLAFECADELGILIQWGGDWDDDGIPVYRDPDEDFYDGPHLQIPWDRNLERAREAQKRRVMARTLSPDITPGLKPEDMRDEDFDSPGVIE